jgi:hypothetical protein
MPVAPGRIAHGAEPFDERIAARGAPRIDRLAVLAVLRRLEEQVRGHLNHLAVDGDDPGRLVDLDRLARGG